MRLVLVPNAELGTRPSDYRPTMPLGLLSIASTLKPTLAASALIVDPRAVDFQPPEAMTNLILALEPDAVGFSTMCNTYPHALRTAQLLKTRRRSLPVVFGGPHASMVGHDTIDTFDFIDFVLSGECERSIHDFTDYLGGSQKEPRVPGLIYRCRGRAALSLPCYPMLPPDELPDIDYSLFNNLEDFGSLPLDVGRGCPFGCSFCTTNLFWERHYRLRSAQYLIETVRHVKAAYGIESFGFVHDNFTAAPPRVAQFCRDVIASGVEFEWRCSARPDSVDGELLDLMYAAGCRSIFMGIESGSGRVQQLCRKRVKLERVGPAIEKATNLGINLKTSFIVGFPYEDLDDVEKTLRMMASINYESRTSSELQLHLLAPVPGAPLSEEAHVKIGLDERLSDISAAGDLDETMKTWINRLGRPIFESFFHYLNASISREHILQLRLGWFTVFTHLKLTALALEVARREEDFRMVSVFMSEKLPLVENGARETFEWCVSSLRRFLQSMSGASWEGVRAVLEFEADVHRLRLSGGGKLVNSNRDVHGWSERVLQAGSAVAGLPPKSRDHYFLMAFGDSVKITRLPRALAK